MTIHGMNHRVQDLHHNGPWEAHDQILNSHKITKPASHSQTQQSHDAIARTAHNDAINY